MGVPIELDIANGQHRGNALRIGPPQDGPDARHEFRQRERLDHIVIGPGGQAANAIGFLAAGGQQDDGDGPGFLARAQTAAKLQPGDARQHPIQNNEIGRALGNGNLCLVATMDDIDCIAFRFQVVAQEKGQWLLVLDNQDLRSSAAHFIRL